MRLTSVIAALLIAGGLWYWFVLRHDLMVGDPEPMAAAITTTDDGASGQPSSEEDASIKPVPVVVIQSQAQETQGSLLIRGRTHANRNVEVASETTGRVISEALPSGSRVTAGQVLCRLNPGVRDAELAEAKAVLAEAQAEASAAKQLKQKGFTADTTLKTAEAQLQAAQARLDRVKWDIAQLDIKAPFDGVLETDTAEIGTLMTPGSVCADVIDLMRVKVTAYVAEQEVDLLSLGQPADARLINGVEAEGQISFLSRMADELTRTFAVEVTIENPDGSIRDGMTAELRVGLPPETAHLLPHTVLTLDDLGRMGVRVDEDGVARFYPVDILSETAEGIWLGGLPETANVIVVGQEFVRDGRRVIGTVAGVDTDQ
ncbi:MAG: efflux RND transporter periplasmic adaptor subunit [Pseudomonadota bacterium]